MESLVFDRSSLDKVTGPIVYMVSQRKIGKEERECLYIGYSSVGLSRLFNQNHIMACVLFGDHWWSDSMDPESTEVEILFFSNTNEAKRKERELIKQYNPLFNKRGAAPWAKDAGLQREMRRHATQKYITIDQLCKAASTTQLGVE